jgi:hypothetical protein
LAPGARKTETWLASFLRNDFSSSRDSAGEAGLINGGLDRRERIVGETMIENVSERGWNAKTLWLDETP